MRETHRSGAATYAYDDNGNMTMDLNKRIVSVAYNTLNLPQLITFQDSSKVSYLYDTDGNKLRVTNTGGLLSPDPNSVHIVDYCGNCIYEDGTLSRILIDGGYITFTNNQPIYHFYIQDHLGNIRVVADQSGVAEQVYHYYPYGGIIADISTNQDIQRHKYNGKEYDRMYGLNLYDYGARHYDPATLAWTAMGPLAEKYYPNTPYGYCHDNPTNRIDPDGNDDYYTKDGIFLRSDNKTTNYVYVGNNQLMFHGKPITSEDFQSKASTIYAESSIGYGIAYLKEMFAIASVHLRNNKAFGLNASLAKSFRSVPLIEQSPEMQMANAALINALLSGKDYSNGATQWDGAEQAMVPLGFIDKPSNGRFMFKMNTMGWSMTKDDYSSGKKAIENKFGKGRFSVPQEKRAISNYGGMRNKGRIRLYSTAQYGLTIFWKEVR